jgi:tetratricopeptide (TPR) repeat protein
VSASDELERAFALDREGRERDALLHYRSALGGEGLAADERRRGLLGLGSTLRALGEYEEAVDVLSAARGEFPDDRAFEPFLALALYNVGRHAEAVELLATCLAETTSDEAIASYRRALLFYAPRLDETWGQEDSD